MPDPQKQKLTLKVKTLLWEKGQNALEMAKQSVLQEKIPYQPLQTALEYFMSSWEDVLHPALMTLTSEAVGGQAESTTQAGIAFVLLAGGADVHDDIIDESTFKYSKPTVLGKFGKDSAVLVGDALLFKGLYSLHEACATLPENKKKAVLDLTKRAFFEISSAEAKEASLHGKIDPYAAGEYLEMIKTKAAVSEATAKIGAILGGGNPEEVGAMGSFGRVFAILLTIRDEFIDMFEYDEFKNRTEKECLPLPVLYALTEPERAQEITHLLEKGQITEKEQENILDLVFESNATHQLQTGMHKMVKEEIQRLHKAKICPNEFKMILQSTVEDL
jgi:geranylgeranyl pyrophosphate synthase